MKIYRRLNDYTIGKFAFYLQIATANFRLRAKLFVSITLLHPISTFCLLVIYIITIVVLKFRLLIF